MSTRLERLAKRVHAVMPQDAKCLFGIKGLKQHEQPKRLVWISAGGTVDPAKRTGGKLVTDASGAQTRINIVAERFEVIEVHVYALDAERVEELFDALIAAIHQELGPNAPYPWKYSWFGESQDAGLAQNTKPKMVLMFNALMPVSEQALGLRTITEFKHGHSEADGEPLPDNPHTNPH